MSALSCYDEQRRDAQTTEARVLLARRVVILAARRSEAVGKGVCTEQHPLLIDELRWADDQLQRMPWQEALWNHLRALLCAADPHKRR